MQIEREPKPALRTPAASGPPGPEPPPHPGLNGHAADHSLGAPGLNVIDPAIWQGKPVPTRQWLVPGWIPMGRVTTLSGATAAGKTLLAQQLQTSSRVRQPWLGLPVLWATSVGIYCEDDEAELHARQAAINRSLGCEMRDLAGVGLLPRLGENNLLMTFDGAEGRTTPFYDQILEQAKAIGARLLIVDTKSDVFGGNLLDASHARQFVQHCLGRLARELDAAVLLLDHPSVRGNATGSGESGSVQWFATNRAALFLTAPKGDDPANPERDHRELKTMKANLAAAGDTIALRWQDGVFVRVDTPTNRPIDVIDQIDLDNRVIAELRGMIEAGGVFPTDWNAARAFANSIRKRPGWARYHQSVLVASQQRLLKSGRAVSVAIKTGARPRMCIRPVDARYPGEDKGV